MTDHDPQLVDRLAQAIANATTPGVAQWWETITGCFGIGYQPGLVADYRRMASAALDAMPHAAEVRRP